MGRLFQQNDCWHGNGALCGGGIEVICKVGCFSHKVVTFSKMPSSTGLNYWVLSSSLPPKSKHSIWWWGSTYSAVICVQSSSFMHGSWRMLERKTRQKMTVSLVFMWLCWSFFHRRNFTRNILINWNHSLSQIARFHGSVVGIRHTQRQILWCGSQLCKYSFLVEVSLHSCHSNAATEAEEKDKDSQDPKPVVSCVQDFFCPSTSNQWKDRLLTGETGWRWFTAA